MKGCLKACLVNTGVPVPMHFRVDTHRVSVHLQGKPVYPFILASILEIGQPVKERTFSCRTKFFSLGAVPIFEELDAQRKQTRSHTSCFSWRWIHPP